MNERQHIALTEAQIIAAEKGELQLETRDGRKVVQFVWFREPFNQNRDCLCVICENGCNFLFKKTGIWASSISPHDLFVSEPSIEPEQVSPKPNIKDLTKEFLKVGEIGVFEGVEYLGCEESITSSCSGCDLYTNNTICGVECCDTILKRVDTSTEPAKPKPLYEVGEVIEVKQGGVWIDAEYRDSKGGYIVVWLGDNFRYRDFSESFHRKKQTEKTVTLENKVMTVKEAFKYLTNL